MRGADVAAPIHKSAQGPTLDALTQTTPALTTTLPGCLVLSAFAIDHNRGASYSATGAAESWDVMEAGTNHVQASYSETQTAAGTIARRATLSSARTDGVANAIASIVAIAPAFTPGAPPAPTAPAAPPSGEALGLGGALPPRLAESTGQVFHVSISGSDASPGTRRPRVLANERRARRARARAASLPFRTSSAA